MVQKIEIKSRWTGEVIFTHECEDNTIAKTVMEAVRQHADLRSADLSSADLLSADLSYADLSSADLSYADLSSADLSYANLRSANLLSANLCSANLRSADLLSANLRHANLLSADLSYADLSYADLLSANLRSADLLSANLCSASLSHANLRYANLSDVRYNEGTAFLALQCPEEGEFIAWKKVKGCIVKLLIPADAQRSSATSRKCRAGKAHVLAILDKDGNEKESVVNDSYVTTTYKVGEDVLPNSWDDDRWNECSHGIHFFITRREAELYI